MALTINRLVGALQIFFREIELLPHDLVVALEFGRHQEEVDVLVVDDVTCRKVGDKWQVIKIGV